MKAITMEYLLGCYYRTDMEADTPTKKTAKSELMAQQLINDKNDMTPRGNYYVKMLLATPLPVERWGDPREGEHDTDRS